jgi:FKBP-type peptidyl-prolyl cis-trans isomerase
VISRLFRAVPRTGRRLPVALAVALAAMLTTSSIQVYAQQGAAPGAAPGAHHKAGTSNPSGAGDVKSEGSYSLGVLLGAIARRSGLTANDISFEKLTQGVRAATSGKVQPSPDDQQHVQRLIAQVQTAAAETNKAAARKFLAENARQPGVTTTASGLQYRIVSEGKGASPKPTDTVTVNYKGTLLDGSVFDSSAAHGRPAVFPVNQVIKGWTEALLMMKPGAKWQLYIPPELAYGDRSPAPVVPPGSLLKFDVELLSFAATPAAGGGAPNARGAVPGAGSGGGGGR